MRAQRGFTLVELVTVLMLIGILGVVAVPRLLDMNQFSTRGARDVVGASLRHAQKSAIAMRRNVCVSVSGASMNMRYASTSGVNQACNTDLVNPANGQPYSATANALPAPITGTVNVIFDAQGRPLSAPSTPRVSALTITVTGHATPIIIEPETGTVH